MNYLVELHLLDTARSTRSRSERGQILAFSADEIQNDLNAWLKTNNCPTLPHWDFGAQSGSNTPASRGVLNTVHYDLVNRGSKPGDNKVVKTLLVTVYALRPIDPIKERVL
jgi:hypothetical protein